MNDAVMVTTTDNPFNPFTDYDQWYMYDLAKGYRTCERLASITVWSDQLSDLENTESVSNAIDQMIKTGCISKDGTIVEYKKVFKSQLNKENETKAQEQQKEDTDTPGEGSKN